MKELVNQKCKCKRVLCPVCGKTIHIDDFGGVAKQGDGSIGIYHLKCMSKEIIFRELLED